MNHTYLNINKLKTKLEVKEYGTYMIMGLLTMVIILLVFIINFILSI